MCISRSYIASLMIGLLLSLQLPMAAHAAMVPTSTLLQVEQATQVKAMDRDFLVASLQQKELQEKMVQLGVDPAVVIDRVKNMTDAELANLNEKIQDMPAGGSVLGWIVFLFVVFIITDALGVTDVFSFVKPID